MCNAPNLHTQNHLGVLMGVTHLSNKKYDCLIN